uniref:V-SNARE coiled-coil homology domain-containing protein n=1 Tax=Nothobranchius furzeri TaxID=105023 RepID=A0A8C6MCF2_NOTFU
MSNVGPEGSNKRLQQTQAQVDEVVDIMRVNVDKVLERDQKLSDLDDRADALQAGASQFETSAAKLKRKYWWKNCKVKWTVFDIAPSRVLEPPKALYNTISHSPIHTHIHTPVGMSYNVATAALGRTDGCEQGPKLTLATRQMRVNCSIWRVNF